MELSTFNTWPQCDVLDRRATPFDVEAFCEDSMVRLHQREQVENIRASRWPLMNATSGTLRPFSKNRLIASWRRSWKSMPYPQL